MGLLDRFVKGNQNKKVLGNRTPPRIYVYYSIYKLFGQPFTSEFINRDNIEYLNPFSPSYKGTANTSFGLVFLRSGTKGLIRKYPNAIMGDVNNCFEMMTHHFYWQDTDTGSVVDLEGIKAYHPTQLNFYDMDSISTYHIVLIGKDCELRQTNYVHSEKGEYAWDLSDPKQIDNHFPVTDPEVIKRIEFSFHCFLLGEQKYIERITELKEKIKTIRKPLCQVFGIKKEPYHAKTIDQIMTFLENKYLVRYIDWKLDYEDVLSDFNKLLIGKKLPELQKSIKLDLLGEEAARDIIKDFSHNEYIPVLIDTQSDGFYISLLDQKAKENLQPLLKEIGFSYMI